MSAVLSKKQQKAQAFRAKQKTKAKGLPVPEDVPENDLVEDNGDDETEIALASTSATATTAKAEGKKRKRSDDEGEEATAEADDGKKAKAKKGKTAWDEEGEDKDKPKSKKDIKQRFILFVGNLGFKTPREAVANHFKEAAGRIPAVRLLTERAESGKPAKSRGIAFVELATSAEMQACLRLHHTLLNGREINVELTAGGGGKGKERKGKINERNKRIGEQRDRRTEREREAAIAAGEVVPPVVSASGEGPANYGKRTGGAGKSTEGGEGGNNNDEVAPEGFKMRNGRRIKIQPRGNAGGRDGGGSWNGGRGGASAGGAGRPPARGKWQPTGANAVSVGQ